MSEEITLRVDVPEVVETPIRIEVRCGKTECEVAEHGVKGSTSWAAWNNGHIVGEGGKKGYSIERALADARKYVRDEERRRLLHAELRAALDGVEVSS